MSHACRLLPHDFFATLALAVSIHASTTGPDAAAPEVRSRHETTCVSGGIGSDEYDAMRVMTCRFNVRLNVISVNTGEALSDVDVSVADDRSELHLRVRTEGPLLYTHLPHEHYQTTTAYRGMVQTVNVSAGTQPVDVIVRLRVEPGPGEWLLCQRGCSCTGTCPTAR